MTLPAMRSPAFDARIQRVNRVAREAAKLHTRVTLLETTPLLSGPAGGFAAFVAAGSGRVVWLRSDDGIHLSDDGGAMVAREVVEWITGRLLAAATPLSQAALDQAARDRSDDGARTSPRSPR